MAAPVLKPTAYEEFLALGETRVGEILNGELYALPRPPKRHAWASSNLGAELIGPFGRGRGGPGGWVILDEPELHLGHDILVPDLAGWRRERAPVIDDAAYFDTAPDWVCEILSSSTARIDRSIKLPIYFRQHVQHVWLIDPSAQTLEVLVRADQGWLLRHVFTQSEMVRAPPFEAIELALSGLWAPQTTSD
jgi:Uma2 family endonuclease